jgi:hypothetical protein
MVAESLAQRLEGRYEFGPSQAVDLKGRGPTSVRFLIGRSATVAASAAS